MFVDPMTVLYGFYLEVLNFINSYVVEWFTKQYNYQYQKDYNDQYQLQMFMFSFIIYYMPMMYIAFWKFNFFALYSLMFTVVVIEQLKKIFFRIFCINLRNSKKQQTYIE